MIFNNFFDFEKIWVLLCNTIELVSFSDKIRYGLYYN